MQRTRVCVDPPPTPNETLQIMWDQRYTRAVVSDFQSWHVGWRLEDLAQQSADQRSRISALMDALEKVPPQADDGRTLKAAWGGTGAERSGDLGRKVYRGVVLAKVLAEEEDLNRLVSVQCDTRPGIYLQVCSIPFSCWVLMGWCLVVMLVSG